MNDFDKDNLEFFISTSQEEFDAWCDEASTAEINYAFNLIRQARRELEEHEQELMDLVEDTSQAEAILKQFTLGK